MSNFLFVDDEETVGKIDIDSLYEKKQQKDLKQMGIFNKILNRIHKRINMTGKNKVKDKHIFFQVPEFIFGEPLYKQGDCIGFLVVKLEENGFEVQYMHPNTLFITWKNHVPSYVRNEIKKKTGVVVDEKGNILNQEELDEQKEQDPTSKLLNDRNQPVDNNKNKKEYTPIDEYTPSGNFVYKDDMLKKIEKKMNS
mgnify:CR=1 FL=1